MTTFADGLYQFGGMPVGPAGVPAPFTGDWWFVDPVNGADGNSGRAPNRALATLYQAHNKAASGNNDVVVLMGNGEASGSARLSLALAQTIDPTATTGTLTWSKSALHLIGVCPPGGNPRARIAPPSGVYTEATFNSLNFVVVTGSGCMFQNIACYQGFSTGAAGQIAWTDSGGRNFYNGCAFLGMNDAASAQATASRSLKITGVNGEHLFQNCIIGGDTTTRTVANASLELAGATPRNIFRNCTFPFQTSAAGVLGILLTGAGAVDRWNLFENCSFINNIKSTSTQMTVLTSMTNAAPGGLLLMNQCVSLGITEWGDTNGLANTYVNMSAPTAATGGIAVNPS